jgi:Polysaccharide pyruvyl transferase
LSPELKRFYIGWTGHYNLGDDLMWEMFRKRFTGYQFCPLDPTSNGLSQFGEAAEYTRPTLAQAVLGGGTLINSGHIAWLRSYRLAKMHSRQKVYTFGTGVNAPSDFSCLLDWHDCRREWVAFCDDLEKVGVRGPLSKALLEEAGARNVEIVGDPVVMLHQPLAVTNARPGAFGPHHQLRVAINIGVTSPPLFPTVRRTIELLS